MCFFVEICFRLIILFYVFDILFSSSSFVFIFFICMFFFIFIQYELTVVALDGVNEQETLVVIKIRDVNDLPPVFNKPKFETTISEETVHKTEFILQVNFSLSKCRTKMSTSVKQDFIPSFILPFDNFIVFAVLVPLLSLSGQSLENLDEVSKSANKRKTHFTPNKRDFTMSNFIQIPYWLLQIIKNIFPRSLQLMGIRTDRKILSISSRAKALIQIDLTNPSLTSTKPLAKYLF